ncbi:MAG: septal ring lytic transglycosylase RlpA family protein [Burkholderiales bacterium]
MIRNAPTFTFSTAVTRLWGRFLLPAVMLALAGCSSVPKAPISSAGAPSGNPANSGSGSNNSSHRTDYAARLPVLPPAGSGRGGYYQDDGPGDNPPDGLLDLPDVIPKIEPYSLTGNKPYAVFGKTYTPLIDQQPYKERGIGSWYGKKFHGQKTSSGEPYDMYKVTAAHPILPIPSYARVTNLSNGVQVIVRINDRGPFHSDRIIDLSYAAALKLGYLGKGSSELEIERLLPEEIARINDARQPEQASQVAAAPIAAPTATAAHPVDGAGLAAPAALDSSGPVTGNWDLQLGAFAAIDHAEAARARLMQTWDSALPPLEITFVGLFYRLHCGPFATRAEAALAAEKVQAISESKPLVVQR